jgi:exoribonuclease R
MRVRQAARESDAAIQSGLDAIRTQMHVPGEFPDGVLAAADEAAKRDPSGSHVDRTSVEFRTLDPEASTDLDQAFAIDVAGPDPTSADVVLHYAIADVGFFVDHGGPIDAEAWRRGGTVYLPGARVPLYPSALCEAAASLLPDGPRPAVVFTVRIDTDGNAVLDGAERALIHSRAKLAYDTVTADELPAGFDELSKRIVAAEERRDAPRVEFPEQELVRVDGRWVLQFDPRLESEDQNAGMSLATNLAVADALYAAKTGLFRVMAEVPETAVGRLRHTARAFNLEWPSDVSLADFQRSLARDDPKANAFLLAVRRASGGATYEPFEEGREPWHSAMAATYAHATAPLRRLADRYVVEAALAVASNEPVPDDVAAAFAGLPKVMEESERLGGQVDSAVRDLAEAVLLSGREGEVFDGVVVDEDDRGAMMQITEPAVLTRIRASRVDPGSPVRAKLVSANPAERRIEFERVG